MKVAIVAAAAGVTLLFKKAFNEAKQAQEINQKFAVTFREVSKEANAAAKNLADNFGLANDESKELLSTTGDLLSGFGFTGAEALSLSERVNTLAVDLASFSNIEGGASRASAALTSALLGERESAKALGIVISEAAVKEELRRMGLEKSTGDALLRAKAEATYNIAVRQSTNAIGDFNRSQNSTANVQRRLEAQAKNLRIEIGNELLPAFTELGISFLETSKDGGIIQKALIKIAQAAAFVVRTVSGVVEGLNLVTTQSDASNIEARQDALQKKQRAFIKELRESGFQTTKQLTRQTLQGSILLDKYNAIKSEQKELNKLSGENVKQLKGSADRFDDITDKLKNGNKEINAAAKAREKEKKSLKETEKIQDKITKKVKETKKAIDSVIVAQDSFNLVANSSLNILSAFAALQKAQGEKRLEAIDAEEQRELERAGVAEETAIEKAERELAEYIETGETKLLKEKQNAVEREKIYAKFDKKRLKAEYEIAMASWEIQRAMAAIQALQAPLNAYTSTAAIPVIGPAAAPFAAAAAGIAAGLLLASVNEAKPPPPKFEGGGIIPGSSSGTTIIAGENNKSEAIFNQSQMQRLLDIADGNAGGLSRVAPMSKDLMYQDLFQASQDGRLFIADKGVVPV